jgi:hypothetical protein
METATQTSALGPALFIGLSFYVLVTSTPAEPEYPNPADMMNIDEVTSIALLRSAIAPFPDQPPPIPPPKAPGEKAVQALAPPTESERGAIVSSERVVPVFSIFWELLQAPLLTELLQTQMPAIDVASRSPIPAKVASTAIETRFVAPQHDWFVTNGSAVNVRAGPNIADQSITQLDSGELGLRIRAEGAWTLLQFLEVDGVSSGWVFSEFLAPVEQ